MPESDKQIKKWKRVGGGDFSHPYKLQRIILVSSSFANLIDTRDALDLSSCEGFFTQDHSRGGGVKLGSSYESFWIKRN